jgi:hypothetical protein
MRSSQRLNLASRLLKQLDRVVLFGDSRASRFVGIAGCSFVGGKSNFNDVVDVFRANLSARLQLDALSFASRQPEPLPSGWKIRTYFFKVPLPGVLASAAAAT